MVLFAWGRRYWHLFCLGFARGGFAWGCEAGVYLAYYSLFTVESNILSKLLPFYESNTFWQKIKAMT